MGISIAKRAGLVLALISGEDSPLVDRFAHKMGIADVHKGCKDKAAAVRKFALDRGFSPGEVGFIGDDVNDLPAMSVVGFSAAPSDAHPDVRRRAGYVAQACGGRGAVREILEHLMASGGPAGSSSE
jgi:3-deoxy-D-manno-octulosonate 8-phosphate phosphatase (KDO 8-P phosphatase)